MQRNPLLLAFLLRTALCLPVCLALWFWLAEWLSGPAVVLSGWIMRQCFPGWAGALEWSQQTVNLVTSLQLDVARGSDGQYAVMVAEANPMSYGYGLPLFAALFLASGVARRWGALLLGSGLLIPFQVWGICFDLLKQVAITAGPAIALQAGFEPWQKEGIALGYQLGALIFPTVVPIVVWLACNRSFIPLLMLEGELKREEASAVD